MRELETAACGPCRVLHGDAFARLAGRFRRDARFRRLCLARMDREQRAAAAVVMHLSPEDLDG